MLSPDLYDEIGGDGDSVNLVVVGTRVVERLHAETDTLEMCVELANAVQATDESQIEFSPAFLDAARNKLLRAQVTLPAYIDVLLAHRQAAALWDASTPGMVATALRSTPHTKDMFGIRLLKSDEAMLLRQQEQPVGQCCKLNLMCGVTCHVMFRSRAYCECLSGHASVGSLGHAVLGRHDARRSIWLGLEIPAALVLRASL